MAGNLTRFEPFGDIASFEPLRGFDELFRNFGLRPSLRDYAIEPGIKIDVSENDEGYTVTAEVPGVKKDDIKVAVDGNQVSISAEVRKQTEEKEGKNLRSERYYGRQSRSFTLAHDIDDGKAVAKYEDGVLKLLLPKKTGKTSKQIDIK